MATTQNTFTGNGSNLGPFSFTFKWLESTDIKVSVGGVLKTAGTHYNLQSLNYTTKTGGQVLFTAGNAPANNAAIRIYRDTDDEALSAVFSSGSAIRAKDLNDNFTQNLYVTQEVNNNALNVDGSNPMVGNLNMGGYQIDNLGEPTSDSDAATKKYIDDRYGNLSIPGFTRWSKTAVGGETTLSGAGTTGGTLAYSPNREQVYLNGAQLQRDADYTANNGTSIVLNVALIAGDVVEVICVNNLNTGTTAQAQDVYWNQSGSGAVTRTVESKLRDVVSVKDFGAKGNGTDDDTEEIQAAIDAVSAAPLGGILHFPDGTYLVGTLTVGPSVTLLGAGATLKARTGSNSIIRITGNKDITISGFIFDALNLTLAGLPAQDAGSGACCIYNRTGVDPVNVTISDNRFINIPMPATATQLYHAVLLNGANCTVDNNYVDQSDGDILNFNGGVAFVSNNHVRNSTDGGIAFNNGARGVINSNYLFKCNLGVGAGPEGNTTDPQLYHSILVTNNVFDSCEWGVNFGWFAYAGRTAPTNFTVDSNVFQNCKTHGFRYDGHTANFDANGVISNNVFYRGGSNAYNGTAATDSTDITLINCAGTVVSGNTLSENIASSTRRGIVIQSCSRIDVTGNAINSITLGYTTGIRVTNAQYGNLSANNIRNTGNGIEIDGSGSGNRIHVEGNAIADFSNKGIIITNTTVGTTVTNNRLITDASVVGIDISPASTWLTCDFNVVETAGANAIVLNTSATADNYSISYNRAFTKGVIDGGPVGATKNVTGNW